MRGTIHAAGVLGQEVWGQENIIIHAAGVWVLGLRHPRLWRAGDWVEVGRGTNRATLFQQEIGLAEEAVLHSVAVRGFEKAFNLVTKVLEVTGADAEFEHFFNHRQKVSQGANRVEWRSTGWPEEPPRSGQDQRVFNHSQRHTTFVKLFGELSVRPADDSRRPWRQSVGDKHLL